MQESECLHTYQHMSAYFHLFGQNWSEISVVNGILTFSDILECLHIKWNMTAYFDNFSILICFCKNLKAYSPNWISLLISWIFGQSGRKSNNDGKTELTRNILSFNLPKIVKSMHILWEFSVIQNVKTTLREIGPDFSLQFIK